MTTYAGWWAIDLAAYLLSRPSTLKGIIPTELVVDDAIEWIRRNELPWAPGCADLRRRDWEQVKHCADDVDLVDYVLETAAREIDEARAQAKGGDEPPIDLIARRRLPVSTLRAFGYSPSPASGAEDHADAHLHQGAALPVEVTMHWVAKQLGPETEGMREPSSRLLTAVGGGEVFDPLPYLIALRVVLDDRDEWKRALELAERAAPSPGDEEAWTELASLVSPPPERVAKVDLDSIVNLKEDARTTWDDHRRVALYRLEAILHGAITQQAPGLDVFVEAFDDFSSLRRRRLPKPEYYDWSIRQSTMQTSSLRAIELRLGERIYSDHPPSAPELASDYSDALLGYRQVIGDQNSPVRVSFPLSLVKTRPPGHSDPAGWRFDPRGVYALVEAMIQLLDSCPTLAGFVDGLDVCGNECDAPNWLFAPAYVRFANWMKSNRHPVTCRFHAGEWQATPLHGLRRIHEFISFELPPGTPRRIGHALALSSNDWSRLSQQPVDELLDDLVWAYSELHLAGAPGELVRLVQRQINDLVESVYASPPSTDTKLLVTALEARRDLEALRRIGFLANEEALNLPGSGPLTPSRSSDQLLIEHLRAREDPLPTVGELIPEISFGDPAASIERLRLLLSDAYDVLVPEVREDLRWGNVVVESCPTSNVVVGGVRGFRQHPLRQMIDRGVLVALGSDDPSLFHVWIGDEVSTAEKMIRVPARQVGRSQRLGTELVAPGYPSEAILENLDQALSELEVVKRRVSRR